jgi:hypothetical protein
MATSDSGSPGSAIRAIQPLPKRASGEAAGDADAVGDGEADAEAIGDASGVGEGARDGAATGDAHATAHARSSDQELRFIIAWILSANRP